MQKFRNPFALNEKGEIIYIKTGDVGNKEKYKKCYCPECGEKLVARMGEINNWHFSHTGNKKCNGNFETSLHLYAKELIKRSNKVLLPLLSVGDYLEYNRMDEFLIQDMHKWENMNYERICNQPFINANVYPYIWEDNEVRLGDFIPDCIVEIGQKKLAIEICVTHAVNEEKEEKVKKAGIDMIEINLGHILEDMQDEKFDMDRYILYDSFRSWIYKTRVRSVEEKLYQKIYNTKKYVVNEKYTREELIVKRNLENEKKLTDDKLKAQKELRKQERKKYAIEHREEIRNKTFKNFLKVVESYSHRIKNDDICVCNIPVKGEYAFKCARDVWEKAIYDTFILNREDKIIQLAKIISWIEKHSRLEYFKEFDYSKNEIWDSKYDAVKNYLIELEKLKVLDFLEYSITKFGQIKVINSKKDDANLKFADEYKRKWVCKKCGKIFGNSDCINKFYIMNWGFDEKCYKKMIIEIQK